MFELVFLDTLGAEFEFSKAKSKIISPIFLPDCHHTLNIKMVHVFEPFVLIGSVFYARWKTHSTAMESEPNTTTSSTCTTTIATTSSPSRTQPPQISVYSGSDRHAVQVSDSWCTTDTYSCLKIHCESRRKCICNTFIFCGAICLLI